MNPPFSDLFPDDESSSDVESNFDDGLSDDSDDYSLNDDQEAEKSSENQRNILKVRVMGGEEEVEIPAGINIDDPEIRSFMIDSITRAKSFDTVRDVIPDLGRTVKQALKEGFSDVQTQTPTPNQKVNYRDWLFSDEEKRQYDEILKEHGQEAADAVFEKEVNTRRWVQGEMEKVEQAKKESQLKEAGGRLQSMLVELQKIKPGLPPHDQMIMVNGQQVSALDYKLANEGFYQFLGESGFTKEQFESGQINLPLQYKAFLQQHSVEKKMANPSNRDSYDDAGDRRNKARQTGNRLGGDGTPTGGRISPKLFGAMNHREKKELLQKDPHLFLELIKKSGKMSPKN